MELEAQGPVTIQQGTPVAPVDEPGHAKPPVADPKPTKTEPVPAQDEPFFDRKAYEAARAKLDPSIATHADALYHQLNKDYTQKAQKLAAERQKVEVYNRFTASLRENPGQAFKDLFGAIGMTPAQALQLIGGPAPATPAPAKDQEDPFQTREELAKWVQEQARLEAEKLMADRMAPVMKTMQEAQSKAVEAQLNELDPQWLMYEDAMRENLQKHPSLANDLPTLYRISVPAEVLERKAHAEAMRRMDAERDAARVSGGSTVRASTPPPPEVRTFEDAVKTAKKVLGMS